MDGRARLENEEEHTLSPEATRSRASKGRRLPEPPCPWRTCFQRDRDRILHAKAFRRLGHKTQVFLAPEGDHYRTRLTHTLEVAQVARTMARLLRLNTDLTEAIALGHDLGHTPFGHAGETALDSLLHAGFRHNEQSLRVVDYLERTEHSFLGLNLTWEVRDGILRHTGDQIPSTWEGRIVRLADRIAYLNHDIDDAIRAGILAEEDLPRDLVAVLGSTYSKRLNNWISDLVETSLAAGEVRQSDVMEQATTALREFLFDRVYIGSAAKLEEAKVSLMLRALFEHHVSHAEELPEDGADDIQRRVADYIAGMTDRFAIAEFNRIFVPSSWAG
ncbi:MAG: deoxyguanosinetriphosphate triphosphohydrolase [Bacteroidota bacterium]